MANARVGAIKAGSARAAATLATVAAFATSAGVVHAEQSEARNASVGGRVWSEDGAPVEGAAIRILPDSGETDARLVATDALGYFVADDLPPGTAVLIVAGFGFAERRLRVRAVASQEVEVEIVLERRPFELDPLEVSVERSRDRARFEESIGETVLDIDLEEMQSIPTIAESDPLRAVETLPGVTTVSDVTAAYNVRGGSADQNLVLLDDVPLYNPFHLLGVFSVFNADMVGRAELRAGGFPAEYGGRVSSVLTVESDVGDGSTRVDAGVSLLAARAAVAGALPEGVGERLGLANTRWRVSGRRSYIDVVSFRHLPYYMADAHGVFEGWTKGGKRIRLTGYSGRDALNLGRLKGAPLGAETWWGNDAFGGSWVDPMPGGGWLGVRGSVSRFAGGLEIEEMGVRADTRVRRAAVEADIERRPVASVRWKSGVSANHTAYGSESRGGGAWLDASGSGAGLGGYSQVRWNADARWLLEAGLRLDHWRPRVGDVHTALSPRVAVRRFVGGRDVALRVSAGRYVQFAHSLRDEVAPFGMDMWILAGRRAPPVVSYQVQAGAEAFMGRDGAWLGSVEVYLRTLDGVTALNSADNPSDPWDDLVAGAGTAYGADLLVKRTAGAWTGWMSASFLRAERTFPDTRVVAGAQPRPDFTYAPAFDRRLDVDLVLRREFRGGLEMGLRANFGTGLPFRPPLGDFYYHRLQVVDGLLGAGFGNVPTQGSIQGFGEQERYPVRHRVDVSLRKEVRKDWGTVTPYLSILNVYNHNNVLFYTYDYGAATPHRTGYSMLPVLPTFGVEVSF